MPAQRRILVAAAAEHRVAVARAWLREHGRAGAVVVASSRGAADELVREALEPGQGIFGVHRLAPGQLAAALATPLLAGGGLAPVGRLGMEALATRAVTACLAAARLKYVAPVAAAPGFARALARTLDEVRGAGLEPGALAAAGPAGADLEHLHEAYARVLDQAGLVDPAALWDLAAAAVEEGGPLVGLPLLLLDVPVRSALEAGCYGALAAAAPAVLATVVAGDPDTPALLAGVFGVAPAAEGVAAAPARAGERKGAGERETTGERGTTGEQDSTRLERLRRWVFEEGSAGAAPPDDGSLEFLSAPGEGRECVEIARRAQRLAAEGVPFDRMAVLLRHPDGYLALLEEAFRRAAVPAYFTRGTVRPHPAGRAFLALLACAGEGLSASRFAEYLSLGQVPVPDATGAPRMVDVPWVEPEGAQLVFKTLEPEPDVTADPEAADEEQIDAPVLAGSLRTPRRWEQMIVDAAVVGGLARWERRLRGLEAELELRLSDLDDDDERTREHLRELIAGLRNLERFALPVIEMLAELPEAGPWGEWLEALRRLAACTLRRPEQVLTVLAELDPLAPVGPVDLAEVRRVLQERLTTLRVEPESRPYGHVFVGTIDEARGRAFDTVFLPGLAEGIFPRRAGEDPLLLDEARAGLAGTLADQERRIARERLLLRVAAGAAARRLVVSYPTIDALQGRARVPSFYALDVARAAEGALPASDELERRAASSARPRVGWPAPLDPGVAIDAGEFDVATLAPLLGGERSQTRGQARFLLEINEHLARSLRARAMRWRPAFCSADGLVSPGPDAVAVLAEHRLAARSYSPTALQTYAVCPYRFLLYAIHRLRPREEPVALEQIDPLTRGSLFHEVQFLLLNALRDRECLPLTPGNRAEATALADGVLDEVAARYSEDLAPAIPRVWRDEIEGVRTDLRGWIRAVAERDHEWVPSFFELAFGLGAEPGRDPASRRDEAVVLEGYRLRGSIDLVERRARGEGWRVTDHKTGRALRERFVVLGHGEVLQPLLYALAAEHHLDGVVEAGRLFYCTRRGEYETREVALNADTRQKASQVLGFIDKAVADGFLPAAPREKACAWCDFRTVCGPYEELRVRGKDRRGLADLQKLRGAP